MPSHPSSVRPTPIPSPLAGAPGCTSLLHAGPAEQHHPLQHAQAPAAEVRPGPGRSLCLTPACPWASRVPPGLESPIKWRSNITQV